MKTVAVILAAGPGTRLTPHTRIMPKCLVNIGKHPILYYQLKSLEQISVDKIIITVGYKKKMIIDYVKKNFPHLKFNFVENPIYYKTNTLYSLALASEKIMDERNIILLNGDVLFDPQIISFIQEAENKKNFSCVQFKKCGKEEIKFQLNKDGSIKTLNKKINLKETAGESIGINKFALLFWKDLSINLKLLKNKYSNEYFEYAIEKTLNKHNKLWPFDIGKLSATEIDFPKDLKKARRELKPLSF